MADRGVSGPWDPQFCGALCNGVTQRIPAGVLGALQTPPAGSGAEPRRQTHFGNNILKLIENQVSLSQSIPIIPIRQATVQPMENQVIQVDYMKFVI